MNTHISRACLIACAIIFFASCGNDKKQFTVKGIISNADSTTLYLEKRGLSDITVLDSVKLDATGDYSFSQDALEYSEYFRLNLNKQSINFSVDSTETITINADKNTFTTDYTVEGSPSSIQIKEVVLEYNKLSRSIKDLQQQLTDKKISGQQFFNNIDTLVSAYKNKTKHFITENSLSTASYYALFQKIDGYLIFDLNNAKDVQIFQSVGTTWNSFRPNSPRSKQLNDFTLMALANLRSEREKEATLKKLEEQQPTEHKDFFMVSLPNVENKMVSTKSLIGKIVLLDFTSYLGEFSVLHNVRLNKAYEKYKSALEIYQVSFDPQKHDWQNAAVNLPWITVRDEKTNASELLSKFNLSALPTTFLIDRKGNVVKRLGINDDFEAEIAKIL